MKAFVAILFLTACGFPEPLGAPAQPDAVVTSPDAPVDQSTDVMPDPPPPLARGVALDGITQFTAGTNVFTKVPYSNETYDDDFAFENNTFTAATGGEYEVCAALSLAQAIRLELDIFVNNVRITAIAHGSNGFVGGCRTVSVSPGARIDVRMYHEAGSTITVVPTTASQWLTIYAQQVPLEVKTAASFSVPASTLTKIPFSQELRDRDAAFDSSTNRFVAAEDDDYRLCVSISAFASNQILAVHVFVNNSQIRTVATDQFIAGGCTMLRLATGDVLETRVSHRAANAVTVTHDTLWNWLTIGRTPAQVQLSTAPTFTAPAGLFVAIPYAQELVDDEVAFDADTFTAEFAGDYEVCASLSNTGSTTPLELAIFHNNTRGPTIARGAVVVDGCRVVRVAATDQLQVRVLAASTISRAGDAKSDWMTIRRL